MVFSMSEVIARGNKTKWKCNIVKIKKRGGRGTPEVEVYECNCLKPWICILDISYVLLLLFDPLFSYNAQPLINPSKMNYSRTISSEQEGFNVTVSNKYLRGGHSTSTKERKKEFSLIFTIIFGERKREKKLRWLKRPIKKCACNFRCHTHSFAL